MPLSSKEYELLEHIITTGTRRKSRLISEKQTMSRLCIKLGVKNAAHLVWVAYWQQAIPLLTGEDFTPAKTRHVSTHECITAKRKLLDVA